MLFRSKKIYIAADHAGFELKQFLINELKLLNHQAIDLGCDSSEVSVDYPQYAQKLCQKLLNDEDKAVGILICGSGIGISIAANRFNNIRAALCHNIKSAKLSRAHNDANVLCLGARFTSEKLAKSIAKAFLMTEFEGGRHGRRVEGIDFHS